MPEWVIFAEIRIVGAQRLVDTDLSALLLSFNVAEHVHHIAAG